MSKYDQRIFRDIISAINLAKSGATTQELAQAAVKLSAISATTAIEDERLKELAYMTVRKLKLRPTKEKEKPNE